MTEDQEKVLQTVRRFPASSTNQVMLRAGMRDSLGTYRLLERLERRGLVGRVRPHSSGPWLWTAAEQRK